MAQSLVKLTLESNQYESNLRQAKKSWEDFTNGLGISVSKFTAVTAAVGAVSGALKVASDAFKVNEQAMDEWGRITESASALYDGFLRSLNSGDISGYLSRIDEITRAARDAYDAMDELGTFNAFNQINTQRTRTKYTEDYAAYRTGGVSKQQVQASAKAYQQELRQRQKLELDVYEKTIAEYAAKMGVARGNLEQVLSEYSYDQFNELKATPMTGRKMVYSSPTPYSTTSYEVATPANDTEKIADALRKLTDEELQSLQAIGAQAQRTGEEIAQVDKQLARVMNSKGKTSSSKSSKKTLIGDKDDFVEINGLINNAQEQVRDLQRRINEAPDETIITKLRDQLKVAQAELDRLNGKTVEFTKGLSGFNSETMDAWMSGRQRDLSNSEYGSSEYNSVLSNIVDMKSLKSILETAVQNGIDTAQFDLNPLWEKIFDGENIDDSVWKDLTDTINEKLKELGIEPIKLNVNTGAIENKGKETEKTGKDVELSWRGAASALNEVGNALSAIKDPELNAAATVAKAVASIALGFAQAAASPATTSAGVWGWIAAAVSGLATMISTIEAIHSSTGYAQGGLVRAANGYAVPGNYMSTDKVPILANSGELILNRAQQGNIASQLLGGNREESNGGQPFVSGELIWLGVNNYLRRRGMGEIVTTGR